MSERAVLAAVMRSDSAMQDAARALSDDDWYRPAHADLWRAMRGLHEDGVHVEPRAVYAQATTLSQECLRVLAELATDGLHAGTVSYHCERIVEAATLRSLHQSLVVGWQRATSTEPVEPVALAEEIISDLRQVQRMRTSEPTGMDVLDLVAEVRPETDWVIPGLLARRNRIILTAPEGYGKSTFLRQLAGCAAAGLHPFKPEGIRPARVLVVDAENPTEINQDEYTKLLDYLDALGHLPKRGMLTVEQCGELNLLNHREAANLYALVERLRPDLILIGPLYMLHDENPNDEGPARKLAGVLKKLTYLADGAALVTEAHTPHSDGPGGNLLRPYGASLWKRWPEFGYCLHPVPMKDYSDEAREIAAYMRESLFTPWRGPRATRDWPRKLCAGSRLPWEVVH